MMMNFEYEIMNKIRTTSYSENELLSNFQDHKMQLPLIDAGRTIGTECQNSVSKADIMDNRQNGKIRLAILFGGQSPEHEVSLRSSMSVIKCINRNHYDLTLIGIDKQGRWLLCDEADYLINPQDPARISLAPGKRYLAVLPGHEDAQLIDMTSGQTLPFIDIAFSVLHGAAGEDGSVQGMLSVLNIPFVGSGVLGSAVCMDKDMTKRVLRDAGLSVTPWVTLIRNSSSQPDFNEIIYELGLPLFVKPASLGSSLGVSKVEDLASFQKALTLAFSYDDKVLVETAIKAREIEAAILGTDNPDVSFCGEVIISGDFYTYDSKYNINGSTAPLVVPANLPEGVSEEMQRIARKAFRILGCAVLSRIDFFYTEEGKILINEINSLPGFTPSSVYPLLWKASGLERPELVEKLLLLTLERARKSITSKIDR